MTKEELRMIELLKDAVLDLQQKGGTVPWGFLNEQYNKLCGISIEEELGGVEDDEEEASFEVAPVTKEDISTEESSEEQTDKKDTEESIDLNIDLENVD